MPDLLRAIDFAPELLDAVKDFESGDEPHQKELADWVRDDALRAMRRGTRVWLYVNQANEVVGYGSLGVTRWHYPEPASRKTEVVIVPAVAIRKVFWGKPDGPADGRYSSQIMRELLDQARAWPGGPPAVGLFVHPDNHAAIKLYERFGFRPYFHAFTDPSTGVTYRSFIRPLERSPSGP